MSAVILTLAILAGEPNDIGPSRIQRAQQLRNAVRAAMRAERTAETDAARGEAIHEMALLYGEVIEGSDLTQEEQLRLKALLWSRLTRIKRDLQRQRPGGAPAGDPADSPGERLNLVAHAQAAQLELATATLGGGAELSLRGGAFGGGAVTDDYGEELVDLIERTIAPDTWDTNGGPGSIVYWPQMKVLVVRATEGVHGDLGGLLDGLRRAGR